MSSSFLDLAKAFNTVPHDLLLDVIEAYGVRGTVLDVFKNYITNRTQKVKINGTLCDS